MAALHKIPDKLHHKSKTLPALICAGVGDFADTA